MSIYRNTITGEIRDLNDDLIAAWQAADNPKAAEWEPYSPPPHPEPAPAPDWGAFKSGLLISADVASIMATARAANCEPAVSALPVTLDKAQAGTVSEFAACWALVAASGKATPEAIAAMVASAEACNLPAEFIAAMAIAP